MKKTLSIILAIIMVLSVMPMAFAAVWEPPTISHQPTTEEPYVGLNVPDDGATYQWFVEEILVTDKNATADMRSCLGLPANYDGLVSSYSDGKWTPYKDGLAPAAYFAYDAKAGDVIEMTFDSVPKSAQIENLRETVRFVTIENKAIIEFKNDGEYLVEAIFEKGETAIGATAKLLIEDFVALEGENKETLQNPVDGTTYFCVVTLSDGTKLTSESFKVLHIHTAPETWDCTKGKFCADCGAEMVAAAGTHTAPETWDCTAGYNCTVCGKAVAGKESHAALAIYDCDDGYQCVDCGTTVAAAEHSFENNKCTVCGIYEISMANKSITVEINSQKFVYVKFVPLATATYSLTSEAGLFGGDPEGYILAADKTTQLAYNDNCYSGPMSPEDFRVSYEFQAGETYYFKVYNDSSSEYTWPILLSCNCKGNHTAPATWDCTEGYKCLGCGETVGKADNHTAPDTFDCTVGYDCTVCGTEMAAPATHTEPTEWNCTEGKYCTVCNAEIIAAVENHSAPDTWDCTEGKYCTVCNAEITAAADKHTAPDAWNCTEGKYCTVCNEELIAAVEAHDGGTANCHEKAICDVCDTHYGEIDKNNHHGDTEIRDAVEAGETADGYTGDTYCLGCGEKIADGEAIPMTGCAYCERVHKTFIDECICIIVRFIKLAKSFITVIA